MSERCMMKGCLATVVFCLLMLCSCGKKDAGQLPVAVGQPYGVVIVADSAAAKPVVELLTADVSGLPQPEPTFDVRIVDEQQLDEPSCRYARTLVHVDLDDGKHDSADVGYKRDRWARGQLVVNITAPDARLLGQMLQRSTNARKLVELLTDHEMQLARQQLSRQHNAEAAEEVRRMFGIDMLVPARLTSMKKGNRFIWLSDGPAQRQNICIYTVDGRLPGRDMHHRDSVMRENIKGETDGMYMQTSTAGLRFLDMGKGQTLTRGLWEMKGDAMGGPFVERTVFLGNRTLVAEAFVFSPGAKKRNLVRELEAALNSIKIYQ